MMTFKRSHMVAGLQSKFIIIKIKEMLWIKQTKEVTVSIVFMLILYYIVWFVETGWTTLLLDEM